MTRYPTYAERQELDRQERRAALRMVAVFFLGMCFLWLITEGL